MLEICSAFLLSLLLCCYTLTNIDPNNAALPILHSNQSTYNTFITVLNTDKALARSNPTQQHKINQ